MHLRCELRGHTEDVDLVQGQQVRGICVCPLGIVSTSRDKTVRIWKENSDSEFELDKTLIGHDDFVVSVIWIPPGSLSEFPEGTIATGSKDKMIIIWDVDNGIPAIHLKGHTQQITSLGLLSDGTLVSAAVDGTLKLWSKGHCTNTLMGHEGSVVSLLILPEDHILSGSIDKTIRLWKDASCISVFSGHADTVRCLALAPDLGIVSASHDKTLRLWSMDGSCLTVYEGHAEIVYSCAFSSGRFIASGSEDGTARLWNVDGSCLKSICHPGCVWDVAFLPDNDLVTACSDGIVRIFSEDENRLADPEARQCFDAAVELRREELLASRKGTLPPGVKIDDPSALYMPGLQDGETKIIAEGHGACAYAWSVSDQEWKKLGDVMGTQPGQLASASKFHDGQEWDYVFDVDFEDGAPMKKLCMNKDENPYEVAERFLLAEDLPMAYRDQVIQFLMNNTQMGNAVQFNADPLTGGGAYQPGTNPQTFSLDGLGAFGEASIMASLKYCPMKSYISFQVFKSTQPVGNKIREFNQQVKSQPETEALALTDDEISGGLDHLLGHVERIAGGNRASATQEDLDLLTKLVRYPSDKIFPILDLVRFFILDASYQDTLIQLIGSEFNGELSVAMMALGVHQLSLYMLTNAYVHPKTRSALTSAFGLAMENFKEAIDSPTRNIRVGYSSLVLNMAVQTFMTGKIGLQSEKKEIIDRALAILDVTQKDDTETLFRAIVAVGTLLYDDTALKRWVKGTKLSEILELLKTHPEYPEKLKDALKDLDVILK